MKNAKKEIVKQTANQIIPFFIYSLFSKAILAKLDDNLVTWVETLSRLIDNFK